MLSQESSFLELRIHAETNMHVTTLGHAYLPWFCMYVFFWIQLFFSTPRCRNCWNFGYRYCSCWTCVNFRLVWLQVLHLWLYLGLELCATPVFSDSSRITQTLGPTPTNPKTSWTSWTTNQQKVSLTAPSDFEHGPLSLPVIFVPLDTWWDT